MLRFGTISEVKPGFARVVLDDEMQTDWLQLIVNKAATDSYLYPAETGEFVACLMDEQSENGVILGAVYTAQTKIKNAGPGITSVEFADGTKVIHDANKSELAITAKTVTITGQLTVVGDVRAGLTPATSVSLVKHTHASPGSPPVPTP